MVPQMDNKALLPDNFDKLPKGANFTVFVLSLVYAFSVMDRQLPNLLLEPIKHDLQLTDTEVSLLSGLSFVLLYSFVAIPLSMLAERWSRKGVIGWGTALWGTATTICGMTTSFFQFFVARMGVGVGESALMPSTYSIIADLFPSGKRARATGIFVMGGAIGGGMALLVGAGAIRLVEHYRAQFLLMADISSWRIVLALIGLATLAISPLLFFISDPRHNLDRRAAMHVSDVVRVIWRERKAYSPFAIGISLLNMAVVGFAAWIPTFFIRSHGWSVSDAGIRVGIASVVGGIAGALVGGWLADMLSKRTPVSLLWIIICAATCCTLLTGIISITDFAPTQLFLVGIISLLIYLIAVTGAAIIQELAPPEMRAQFSSICLMAAALVGGGGPTVVAAITDFLFQDELAVGYSIATVWFTALIASLPLFIIPRSAFLRLTLSNRRRSPRPSSSTSAV